jgi:hypothetical protein
MAAFGEHHLCLNQAFMKNMKSSYQLTITYHLLRMKNVKYVIEQQVLDTGSFF